MATLTVGSTTGFYPGQQVTITKNYTPKLLRWPRGKRLAWKIERSIRWVATKCGKYDLWQSQYTCQISGVESETSMTIENQNAAINQGAELLKIRQILYAELDREDKGEDVLTVTHIAANALYWRNKQAENFRKALTNLLRSSDRAWYERDGGHDWRQAVNDAELALGINSPRLPITWSEFEKSITPTESRTKS